MTMMIEGYFTVKEVEDAASFGAAVNKLQHRKIKIVFPTQESYNDWYNKQTATNPAWGVLVTILPKPSIKPQTMGNY